MNAKLCDEVGSIENANGIQPATPMAPATIKPHSRLNSLRIPKNGAITKATDWAIPYLVETFEYVNKPLYSDGDNYYWYY